MDAFYYSIILAVLGTIFTLYGAAYAYVHVYKKIIIPLNKLREESKLEDKTGE